MQSPLPHCHSDSVHSAGAGVVAMGGAVATAWKWHADKFSSHYNWKPTCSPCQKEVKMQRPTHMKLWTKMQSWSCRAGKTDALYLRFQKFCTREIKGKETNWGTITNHSQIHLSHLCSRTSCHTWDCGLCSRHCCTATQTQCKHWVLGSCLLQGNVRKANTRTTH